LQAAKQIVFFVLSIPDWGVTPFADGQDRQKIATAIDAYNETAQKICEQHHVVFIDITTSQRVDGNEKRFFSGRWVASFGEGVC